MFGGMFGHAFTSGCQQCGPGGRFAHVHDAREGRAYFEQHCRSKMQQVLVQEQQMSQTDAEQFLQRHAAFKVKRIKYDDVEQMRTLEAACIITAPGAQQGARKRPRVHVRVTYYTHTGWDTHDFGGSMRFVLVDTQGKRQEQSVVHFKMLERSDVPDFPKDRQFPKEDVELRRWGLTTEALRRLRDTVFGTDWSLAAVLLLLFASVDVGVGVGALAELDSHLTYFVNRDSCLEHHTRVVCGLPLTAEDEGYETEDAMEQLQQLEWPPAQGGAGVGDSLLSDKSYDSMRLAGAQMLQQHRQELAAMRACADSDGYDSDASAPGAGPVAQSRGKENASTSVATGQRRGNEAAQGLRRGFFD